ncbi:MAG: hypothetical protein ACM34O_16215 [Ignavibacteria bacterium]
MNKHQRQIIKSFYTDGRFIITEEKPDNICGNKFKRINIEQYNSIFIS